MVGLIDEGPPLLVGCGRMVGLIGEGPPLLVGCGRVAGEWVLGLGYVSIGSPWRLKRRTCGVGSSVLVVIICCQHLS